MASAKVSASLRSQFATESPFKRILRLVEANVAPALPARQRKILQKLTFIKTQLMHKPLFGHFCAPFQSGFCAQARAHTGMSVPGMGRAIP